MSDLVKRLETVRDLIKAIRKANDSTQIKAKLPDLPAIKQPAPPSMTPSKGVTPKISAGVGPSSNKDPRKVAQQIKDGSMSTKTQKVMLKAQWSDSDIEALDKAAENKLYHIHQGSNRITSKPLSLKDIETQHGGVKKLENSGFRLHPHEPKIEVKKEEEELRPASADPSSI